MAFEQPDLFATSYSKTCQASSIPETTHSDVCWQDLSAQMMPYYRQEAGNGQTQVWSLDPLDVPRGLSSTLNTSDWRSDGAACFLSQILETAQIPSRFFLSAVACTGILRRAEKRRKTLPTQLLEALHSVVGKEEQPQN